MLKITIYTTGKVKESWMNEGINEYTTRLKKVMAIQWVLDFKNVEKLSHYICLDPKGDLMTSEKFAAWLYKTLENQGSRLNLVIGDADGLSPSIRKNSSGFISLSPLTFTHQMTRLILMEQLYRATEIYAGSPYHK